MLRDYAENIGLHNYEYYIDDGFTGRNVNRPAFQKMVADIEEGRVGCVITKDLSRLSRNYIEAGSYIEVFFPRHNVRYIAVTDGVDSLTRKDMDITPFKNILNDMYSRDISKKVLAGRMALSRQGKFCGGQPPLGLMRDPNDHGHLIIDPETAPIIRRIFDMALNGWGSMRIAKQLMAEKVPVSHVKSETKMDVNYYSWGSSRISSLLRNPTYKGSHVVCKTHQIGIRSGTCYRVPKEELEIIDNCHEAIVTPEEWQRVQEIMDRRPPIMEGASCPFYNLFHGLVYCEDCGKSMQLRYEKVGRKDVNRTTKQKREPIDKSFYTCQTYNRLGKNACTSHKIEARDLCRIVLTDILELAADAIKDPEELYSRLADKLMKRGAVNVTALQQEYARLSERNNEIDDTFVSLYNDKAKGILSESRFLKLTEAMENEQKANTARMHEIHASIQETSGQDEDIHSFISMIREYAEITELDEILLNRLIKKIIIGETKKEDGRKTQTVRIQYNFVGEL